MPLPLTLQRPTFKQAPTLSVALALVLTSRLAASVLHVDSAATGSGNGSTWENAYPDLQSAIAAASPGDQIWVAEGVYYPDQGVGQTPDQRDSSFLLPDAVAIYGGFAGDESSLTERHIGAYPTILSGDLLQNDSTSGSTADNAYHVVTADNVGATSILDGFHITSGNADGPSSNNANGGGGLLGNNSATPAITRCSFNGNRSSLLGGAVYLTGTSSPTFSDCSFTGNQTTILGGAICNLNSSIPSFINCSFSANSATGTTSGGGAIFSSQSSSVLLINSILWNNSATNSGTEQLDGPISRNCAKNLIDGAPLGGHIISNSNPLFYRDPNPGGDGQWSGPQDNDYGDLRLQDGSPAYNVGKNSSNTSTTDLASETRLQNGIIDLGSYETPMSLTVTNTDDAGPGSLRNAIDSIVPPGGATILFDPLLNAQTITLSSGQLLIDKDLVLDGSKLPNGITIDAAQSSRVFEITSGSTVAFDTFTVTGGMTADGTSGPDGTASGNGGGILNAGNLALNRITLNFNRTGAGGDGDGGGHGAPSGHGGGIHNSGSLTIQNSTLTDNHTGPGGNGGSGNPNGNSGSGGSGAGIYNSGTLSLFQVTISHNTVGLSGSGNPTSGGSGGGVKQLGQLAITNTLIAQNLAQSGGHDLDGNADTPAGINFIGDPLGATGLGPDVLSGDPLLRPFGAYGGPTPTCPPSYVSPAVNPVNGDTSSPLAIDQRGIDRIIDGVVDIGAAEALPGPLVTSTADDGPGTLRAAIQEVEPGGLIAFHLSMDGTTINLSSGELAISDSFRIDASNLPSGVAIDPAQSSRIFTIDDANGSKFLTVQLTNLTLRNGTTPNNGGAILNHEDLTLTDCHFDSNTANGDGGALFLAEGSALIEGGSFTNNGSTGNGGAFSLALGSAIIQGGSFTDNTASGHGGALALAEGTAIIEDSAFTSNSAAGLNGGGGIAIESAAVLTINDTLLSGNTASSSSLSSGGGGAITTFPTSTLTATRCDFEQNISNRFAGAVSLNTDDATLSECIFTGNSASYGGALYLPATEPVINGCRFLENHSSVAGGALRLVGNSNPADVFVSTIVNCEFSGNWSATGGASSASRAYPLFTNCGFTGNRATSGGGAVAHDNNANASYLNCSFSGNSASSGGALQSGSSAPNLTQCILWGNTAGSGSQTSGFITGNSSGNLIQGSSASYVILTSDPLFAINPDPGPDNSWAGLADNNYGSLRLLPGSDAIDAGSNAIYDESSSTTTDLAGKPRQVNSIDLGAFEGPYVTFGHLYPLLDPDADDNHNGQSNFNDYAFGLDPTAAPDPTAIPTLSGSQLTFSYRSGTADAIPAFQTSSDLSNWRSMIEGIDFTTNDISISGPQVKITLDLLITPETAPKTFFRQSFSLGE